MKKLIFCLKKRNHENKYNEDKTKLLNSSQRLLPTKTLEVLYSCC